MLANYVYYLIIIGIAAVIGGLLLKFVARASNGLATPPPASGKFVFAATGLVAWAFAGFLFYNVMNTTRTWTSFVYFIFSIILFGVGISLFKAASGADQKHAENMAARAQAKAEHARHETEQIRLENARQNAIKNQQLEDEQRRAAEALFRYERELIELKQDYIADARNKGLDVDNLIGLNVRQLQQDADFQDFVRRETVRLQGVQIETQFQLDAANQVQIYDIIAQLETQLTQLRIERRKIETEEPDRKLRKQLLADKDRRITQTEQDINEKNRFLQTANGKETQRLI